MIYRVQARIKDITEEELSALFPNGCEVINKRNSKLFLEIIITTKEELESIPTLLSDYNFKFIGARKPSGQKYGTDQGEESSELLTTTDEIEWLDMAPDEPIVSGTTITGYQRPTAHHEIHNFLGWEDAI